MAVLRYFHQDPKQTSVQESSIVDRLGTALTLKLTNINQSITNNTLAIDDKLNSIPGKSLSTNDFTDEYKDKLNGIEERAEVNVQSDWGEDDDTADSYIKNKPESLPASDVYEWAKQPTKPTYTDDEIIGLSTNYIPVSQKGVYGGVATLGANDGKVPESQLPSYVDDVLEYTNRSKFPSVGESGKIYVDITTNLTYRWTGTQYTEISPSIALGETSSTAYAGDKGKRLADAINDTLNYDDTLDWNTAIAIARVNGIEITAKLPSNPNTWRPISDSVTTTSSTISASLTAVKAAYDLAASKTSNTGTVTSVGLTVPTGLSVSGSPVTTKGTLAITLAKGYSIPTTAKQNAWDAKLDAISDLSTIRSNASHGETAYSWGDHALAGYQPAISDLSTIRSNASEGHTAYSWGDHSKAGYVKSSGVTSVAMTVPTGLAISGSPITSTGTLALSFANGYSIPTTAKLGNWDTAYGWGNHASAGYVKSSGVTKISTTDGVVGGDITTTGTIKANLASYTKNASDIGGKLYAVQLDKSGRLAVDVPWTNTWKPANTSLEGYAPKLTTGGGTIATLASEYVLTFKNGTDTAPVWRLLPANAYLNNTYTVNDGTLNLLASGTTKTTFTANQSGTSTFNIATGSTNGTISVGGADVAVKGLGSRAYDSTNYLPLAGGVLTGDLSSKRSNFDLSKDDNGVKATTYPTTFNILDSGGRISARLENIVKPNGTNGFFLYTRQYNTQGSQFTQRGISYSLTKAGVGTWNVSDAHAFRTALGLGARATDSTDYLPLTGGTITGKLNFKFAHDLTQENNGVTSIGYYGIRMYDKNNYFSAQFLNQVNTNGNNQININLRNRNGSTEYDKSFLITLTKSGVISAFLGGAFTASSFVKSGGTSSQFLKADGSVDSNSYLTGITKTMVTNALGYTPPTLDTNTTYSAGSGLSLSGTTFSLALTKTLVTNALGYTPPTTDTNNAVTLTSTTTDAFYRLLFSGTADDTNRTEGARKNTNIKVNPNHGGVYANGFFRSDASLSDTWTDSYNKNHPWYGIDFRAESGSNYFHSVYSDYFGMCFRTCFIKIAIGDYSAGAAKLARTIYINNARDTNPIIFSVAGTILAENRLLAPNTYTTYIDGRDTDLGGPGPLYILCNQDEPVVIAADISGDLASRYVGIGKRSPSYKLHVNGACAATSFPNTSDIRLKDILKEWAPQLLDIADAPLFLFKWNDRDDNNTHLGTSALYWENKVPEVVTEARDEIGTKSLQYDVLGVANTITLAREVVSLKEEIKLLQALIAELKLLLNN